jgi:SAM-dependent methyltransferase
MEIDPREFNRRAWDEQVRLGNPWTIPVSPDVIKAAHQGRWEIFLTPTRAVPRSWFPEPLVGKDVLCLASGGGQQGPILAAAGANVTVFDNSPAQLARDQEVAKREGLVICTVEGDMCDLSALEDASFDLVLHPVSNNFSSAVRPVWQETFRVLRPGGALISGFGNPVIYIFDWTILDQEHRLEVRHRLPYSDLEAFDAKLMAKAAAEGTPLEFSHTLEDQIGGQLDAGFLIAGFYEDSNPPGKDSDLINRYMPSYMVTRAIKPATVV